MLVIVCGAIIIGAVAGVTLGERAVRLGIFLLLIGVGPMATLYVYETFLYTHGDTSAWGMLSTIAFILLGPLGLVLVIFGFLGRE